MIKYVIQKLILKKIIDKIQPKWEIDDKIIIFLISLSFIMKIELKIVENIVKYRDRFVINFSIIKSGIIFCIVNKINKGKKSRDSLINKIQ